MKLKTIFTLNQIFLISLVSVFSVGSHISWVSESRAKSNKNIMVNIAQTSQYDLQMGNNLRVKKTLRNAVRNYSEVNFACIMLPKDELIYVGSYSLDQRTANENSCKLISTDLLSLEINNNHNSKIATLLVGTTPLNYLEGISTGFFLKLLLLLLATVLSSRFFAQFFIEQFKAILDDSPSNSRFSINEISDLKTLFEKNKEKIGKLKVESAIARTTQMLAHDVRKPFSMIRSLLSILSGTTDGQKSQELAKKFVPEINNAITSVNSMINDVMEVGSNIGPSTSPTSPKFLIHASLKETFKYNQKADIKFQYNLEHHHLIEVDSLKLSRVFSNIIANAVQAMSHKGEIWFNSREISNTNGKYIEFCIGNSGSTISSEDLPNLFEAFFTKNKRSGTGLGLAIAKKIVNSHGGDIWCNSSKLGGVEFFLTLPLSIQPSLNEVDLPKSSKEIFQRAASTVSEHSSSTNDETALAIELVNRLDENNRILKVLVVDDEPFYQHLVKELISGIENLEEKVEVHSLSSAEHALENAMKLSPDLILMDVDLGQNSINGFDVTKSFRQSGLTNKICIHSNRGAFEYQSSALEAGANLFLPKPISKSQLLRLLISISAPEPDLRSNEKNVNLKDKHVIVVEDNILILESWKYIEGSSKKPRRFQSPEEFYSEVIRDPDLLSDASCIITDYHFDDVSSGYNGISFAKKLRSEGIDIPIYLASDGEFDLDKVRKFIDGKVSKVPAQALKEIAVLVHKSRSFN